MIYYHPQTIPLCLILKINYIHRSAHYLIVRVAQTMPGFETLIKHMELFLMGPNRFFSVADSESRLMNLEQTVFTKEKNFLIAKSNKK